MGRTRPYTESIKEMAKDSPDFGRYILAEASQLYLSGEVAAAKIMLRDYIKATMGFKELGEELDKNPKSLMRMLSPSGNPRSNNFSSLLVALQKHEGTQIECRPTAG